MEARDHSGLLEAMQEALAGVGLVSLRLPVQNQPFVTVILPALNEAVNLPHVLPHIPAWVDEVILVDGQSSDGTAEVARQLLPRIRVISQVGRGKGAALRAGVAAARCDILVLMDADGSTDPREIHAFVAALLGGADFVKGSRFSNGAGTADMPVHRRIGNRLLVMLTNLLFGTRYTDITYGYNALWRHHAEALAFEEDGWACEILNNIRAARSGLRVVEAASFESRRIAGQAKLRAFPAGWAILRAVLRERFGSPGVRDPRSPLIVRDDAVASQSAYGDSSL